MATNDQRRRVKFYVLNDMRQWDDRGTGYVSWNYSDKQRCVSIIVKSEIDGLYLIIILLKSHQSLINLIQLLKIKVQFYSIQKY